MKNSLTTQDIISDIEFEIIQGALSKDELGRSIQEVKSYQNKLRSEVFQPGQEMPALREIVGRQFQLNDMLLTMLQEMATATQELQVKSRRLAAWQPAAGGSPALSQTIPVEIKEDELWRQTDDLAAAIEEPLEIKLEARPTNIPIIGPFLHRLKFEIHALIIFYLRKFAKKQTAVNRTYGEWLLYFDAYHHYEDAQIKSRLVALEARLAALEPANDGPSAAAN